MQSQYNTQMFQTGSLIKYGNSGHFSSRSMWGKDAEDKHSTCTSRGVERFFSVGIWSFQRIEFHQHLNPLEIILLCISSWAFQDGIHQDYLWKSGLTHASRIGDPAIPLCLRGIFPLFRCPLWSQECQDSMQHGSLCADPCKSNVHFCGHVWVCLSGIYVQPHYRLDPCKQSCSSLTCILKVMKFS